MPSRPPSCLHAHLPTVASRKRRARDDELHLTLTPSERNFFGRVRAALGAREAFAEFLKCLDLYAAVRMWGLYIYIYVYIYMLLLLHECVLPAGTCWECSCCCDTSF